MHGPSVIDEQEINAVTKMLKSQNLFRFSDNSEVLKFEQEAAELLGMKHSLMVNSGTSAIICTLTDGGIGPGDKVIFPRYTFIATAAAVVAVGAIPIIAEIDDSLGLDPTDVEKKITPYTKAVLPVHMQGVSGRIDQIVDVANRHDLQIFEDCCQCIGGRYRGRFVGTIGNAGAWSLNFFKIISTGEGGSIFTDDYEIYERSAFASDPAMPMWVKDRAEYMQAEDTWMTTPFSRQCYRPSEIMGAMARIQLLKISQILTQTRKLKRTFLEELTVPKGYQLQHIDDPEGDCGISATIIVRDRTSATQYAEALKAEGIHSGTAYNAGFSDRHIYTYWDSILDKNSHHPSDYPWKDPAYKGDIEYTHDMCPNTLSILGRSLRFGFNVNMLEEHAKLIAAAINKVDAVLG